MTPSLNNNSLANNSTNETDYTWPPENRTNSSLKADQAVRLSTTRHNRTAAETGSEIVHKLKQGEAMGDGEDEGNPNSQIAASKLIPDHDNTKPLKATAASTFMVKDTEPIKPIMLRSQLNGQVDSRQATI